MAKRASPRASGTAKGAPARTSRTKPETSPKKSKKATSPALDARPAAGLVASAPEAADKAKTTGKGRTAAAATSARASVVSKAAKTKPPAKPAPTIDAKPTPKGRAKTPAKARAAPAAKRSAKRPETRKKSPKPRYLAAELGQPTDHNGEPIGAGAARARSDEDLQKYALQLWRQMQSGRVVNRYTRAIERAGFTADEVWTAGLAEMRTTSSTADEIRRYRQKVLFRANLLEAIFSETIADLKRLDSIEPAASSARETS